jgi:hypothetical protein
VTVNGRTSKLSPANSIAFEGWQRSFVGKQKCSRKR